MKTRKLSKLEVSSVGMGSAQTFDVVDNTSVAVCKEIMTQCIAEGVTFIDTSPMYGRAEWVLGNVMEGTRDKFQIATKVWCSGFDTAVRQIARSFELLKTDYIEVMQIHNLVDWKSHLPYLEDLKSQGTIGLIGATYGYPDKLPELIDLMKTGRLDTIQISYNVKDRAVEEKVLPLAEERNIGVIVMRPTGKGGLVNELRLQPQIGPLREFGITTWGQALLAWLLSDPRVSVPIPATTKPTRITENAVPGNLETLPQELRLYIEKETDRCI